MKKKKTIISICIALLGILLGVMTAFILGGCTEYKFDDRAVPQETDVMISILPRQGGDVNAPQTRATENEIKSAIVLIYNASRVFEKSADMGTGSPVTLTLREGKKYIFIVANAGTSLRTKLNASPTYTALNGMLSETEDYNGGNYPTQGLLMTGKAEQTIASGSTNSVKVKLNYCLSKISLYLRKGSADVDNITVSALKLNKARSKGYLLKSDMSTSVIDNIVTIVNNQVTGFTAGSDGTLIGEQYTYPTVNATDIAFEITLRHTNTTTTDTYIIYPNASNNTDGTTLEPNNQYKVIVTFSKDESGSLSVSGFTEKNVDFDIG